jgi:PEP-CTERM motif
MLVLIHSFYLNNACSGGSMKKVIALTASLAFSMSASAASFLNGGFEDGNLGSWENGGRNRAGTNNSALTAAYFLGNTSSQVSVVGPGNDPRVGANLNSVFAGNFSARIGDTITGGNGGAIAQTVVNYTASTLNFSWAAVVEPQHDLEDSPIFGVRVIDVTAANAVVYNVSFLAASGASTAGLFRTSTVNSSYLYAPWQSVSVNTTVGNTYRIELFAADCEPTGHLGYAYLDGFGSVTGGGGDNGNTGGNGNVPLPGTVALLALGLAGVALRRKQA